MRHDLAMPGVWTDGDGVLHVDAAVVLVASGYPDTPANRAQLLKAIHEQAAKDGAVVTEIEEP